MNKKEIQNQEDRTFLHEIATPLTVIKLHSKRMLQYWESKKDHPDSGSQIKALGQMISAIQKIEDLHADQKSKIHLREAA